MSHNTISGKISDTMSGSHQKLTEVLNSDDIVAIYVYARYALLAPTTVADTKTYLGYHTSATPELTPEAFNTLFSNINNNGRYWTTQVKVRFVERAEAMVALVNKHYQGLLDALASIDDMLGKSHTRQAPSQQVDVEQVLKDVWWDLSYEEGKNQIASENLQVFRDQLTEYTSDIDLKLELAEQIQDDKIKGTLQRLRSDFFGFVNFAIEAEVGTSALWTQWTSLAGSIEQAKDIAGDIGAGADLPAFYIALLDIVDAFEDASQQTQYLLSCFQDADAYMDTQPKGFIPLGEYQQTSRAWAVILRAECRTASGQWQHSGIELTRFDPLKTRITNENGQLTYREDYPSQAGFCYIPGGNFRDSCKDIRVTLLADCLQSNGEYDTSVLDITYDINPLVVNSDGRLSVAWNVR